MGRQRKEIEELQDATLRQEAIYTDMQRLCDKERAKLSSLRARLRIAIEREAMEQQVEISGETK